ncbi:hypothetical protein [Bradyrhizobium embrapense]
METSLRKYLILDTRSNALALDSEREPMRFPSLEEALTTAVDLQGSGSPESFAVLDDLGNKWLWSKTGTLRVALSDDINHRIQRAIEFDRTKLSLTLQARCRADGIVETSHLVRLPDGPPIPIQPGSSWTTTERYTEKASWFERGTLESFIESLPTRTHKLEKRALNEKSRAIRAEAKARQAQEDYEAGAQMTCQLCGRLIRSKHGTIAHHGYTRPGGGWQTSSCDGTHHPPFEVSNAHLVKTIADYEALCESQALRIENVRNEGEPVEVRIKPHWSENRRHPYVFRFERSNFDRVRASSERQLQSRLTFEDYKDEFLAVLAASLDQTRSILGELRERNKNWRQTREFVDGEFRHFAGSQQAA